MTKAAFATWDNRIAPVFDVARQICLVEADCGKIVKQTREMVVDEIPSQRALRLVEMDIGTLVCGAISKSLYEMVSAHGICVIPFVAGELSEVIQAWLADALRGDAFAMPGCCGRIRRRFQRINCIVKYESCVQGRRHGTRGV
jgi:predicted Fe-Mo cluster-binding NifX family protein